MELDEIIIKYYQILLNIKEISLISENTVRLS
jgi:hypothetical protein